LIISYRHEVVKSLLSSKYCLGNNGDNPLYQKVKEVEESLQLISTLLNTSKEAINITAKNRNMEIKDSSGEIGEEQKRYLGGLRYG